jgi:hypothetical protein
MSAVKIADCFPCPAVKIADCFPCPVSGKPCPTNGALGDIPYYYYPGDCPNYQPCLEQATHDDPYQKNMNDIKDLCIRYLQLQTERERITTSMSLVEASLERQRRDLNPEDLPQIPTTFYVRIEGGLYRLVFDDEDTSFLGLHITSSVQIID